MALQAAELRKRQMACILLWMAGGPSQLETFDPKPGTEHGGETKAIETAVPGISIAEGWDQTAKVMKDIALVRSMTNKEGNHQRATYQLHTGYVPSATVKHPHIGCSMVERAGREPSSTCRTSSASAAPTIGAGFLGAALEPFVVQNPEQAAREHAAQGRRRPVPPPARPARPARGRGLRAHRRRRPGPRPHGALPPDRQDGPLAPDEGLRPRRGARAAPRRLRPNAVRPGLPAGPPAGPGRRHVRRGPLQRLGHPPAEPREGRQARRAGRPGLRHADRRPEAAGHARADPGRLDGRVRPDPQDQPQRRPRPLPQGLQRRPGRRRRQGGPGHRRVESPTAPRSRTTPSPSTTSWPRSATRSRSTRPRR